MRGIRVTLVAVLALSVAGADQPDLDAVAARVVNEAAAVQEGDLVVVAGDVTDMDVLAELSLAVAKVGGHPLLLAQRESDTHRLLDEVPARYDTVIPAWGRVLAASETVLITVGGTQDPARFRDAPPDRVAARAAAYLAVSEEAERRNVRQVWLGNGLYPTDGAARDLGITRDELSTLFWRSLDVDYAALATTAARVGRLVGNGTELRITHKNGTDLKMRIEAQPVTVSDGVLSPDDITAGGSQVHTWLPAGEVIVVAVPGTAEGRIVVDRAPLYGADVLGWTLTVRGGKITGMRANSGLELVKRDYDPAPPCKALVGWVDLGINPSIPAVAGKPVLAWMPAGMVSVGFGSDDWLGGTTSCPYLGYGFLPGSTVRIDRTVLVDQGRLIVPE